MHFCCSRILISILLLVSLSACSSIDYFAHLAKGQISLLWQREKVKELLKSDAISAELKARLILSQKIREFALTELALPLGDSYTSYSDLKRPYVVWNVYAAPELSFESYTWCYPFLGCLAYRGFYDEMRAQRAGKILEDQGYDVKVGGVQAYSTLGFFDDPLLNTFIFKNEVAFIELLIHEISHQKLYIKDDTKFNENFATAVATLGAEQWYRLAKNEDVYETYQTQKQIQQSLVGFVLGYKDQLSDIYEDEFKSETEKKDQKKEIIANMLRQFEVFKLEHKLDSRYDRWVYSMNNASLSTLSNYQELVPGFIALFHQQKNDWPAFYKAVEKLAKLDKVQRHKALVGFTQQSTP
jgi:predicted aminopeptidase